MNEFKTTPPDQNRTLIILVTVIILALISTLSACTVKDSEAGKVSRIEIYSYGKLLKVDTAYGWVYENGYTRSVEYTDRSGRNKSVKGDYIITTLTK